MHVLDEGQQVAREVVADGRSGKSSGDNLKRSEIANNPIVSSSHLIGMRKAT
jgi:hypothetical protein